MRRTVFYICTALLTGVTPAQVPLGDINQIARERDSEPESYVVSGGLTYFIADDGRGEELWVTDGTESGTRIVRDIAPGEFSSFPREVTDLDGQGRVVFACGDGTSGQELWVSDGTEAGTQQLVDIYPGVRSSLPQGLLRIGSRIFFTAEEPTSGIEIWVTDGTAAGTSRVTDLNPGASNSVVRSDTGVVIGNRLVFRATSPTTGRELWITDGTPNGTQLLREFTAGTNSSSITFLGQVGTTQYLSVGSTTFDLWKTDGTTTTLITRLPSRPSSFDHAALQSQLVFRADTDLWVTGGTAATTMVLATGIRPFRLTSVGGNRIYFGSSIAPGRGLWTTDGTVAGTVLVAEPRALSFQEFGTLNGESGQLVFEVVGAGYELWTSDGTAQGTRKFFTLERGLNQLFQHYLTFMPQRREFLFTLLSPSRGGQEPWVTNLTPEGSRPLKNLAEPTTLGSSISQVVAFDDGFYFSANDGRIGPELWRADANGAQLVLDLLPGVLGSAPRSIREWNGKLIFGAFAGSGDPRLFVSDGTASGTTSIANTKVESRLVEYRGELYFAGGTAEDVELWKTDGVSATLVAEIRPGRFGGVPRELTVVADRLFFQATDGVTGFELYVSDGTAAGTRLTADLNPGFFGSSPRNLMAFGDDLLYVASSPAAGNEIFRYDTSSQQISVFVDAEPGPTGSTPMPGVIYNGSLFFQATTANERRELWISDGTPQGTLNFDLNPGRLSSFPESFTLTDQGVVFTAFDPNLGSELWLSDGTRAGTRVIVDAVPGSSSSLPEALSRPGVNDLLILEMDFNQGDGAELAVSDLTLAGTRQLAALNPVGDSSPRVLARNGRMILFSADDGRTGREPWLLDVADAGIAVADRFGSGCPARIGSIPTLSADGSPSLGNATFALQLESAPASSPAATAFGSMRASVSIGSCELLVGGPLVLISAPTNANGRAITPVPVPNMASLLGAELFCQNVAVDGPGLAFSAGLQLIVGR